MNPAQSITRQQDELLVHPLSPVLALRGRDWNLKAAKDEPSIRLILDGTVVRVRFDKKATSISQARRGHCHSEPLAEFGFSRVNLPECFLALLQSLQLPFHGLA
jgi:hypothetical protein